MDHVTGMLRHITIPIMMHVQSIRIPNTRMYFLVLGSFVHIHILRILRRLNQWHLWEKETETQLRGTRFRLTKATIRINDDDEEEEQQQHQQIHSEYV